jgi:hypothetical protein
VIYEASFHFRGYTNKCHCGDQGPHIPYKSEKSTVFPVHHAMMALRGAEVYLHSLLTSALDGDEWSPSHRDSFTPRKEPQYNGIGGCVGPRDGADILEKKYVSSSCLI